MSKSEYQVTLDAVRKQHQQVTSSKEAARQFLIDLGVLDKNGHKVTSEPLACIPQGQD